MIAAKVPAVVARVKAALAAGEQVVIGLQSTGEAALVREICKALGVDDDVLTRPMPSGGAKWGNFYEGLQRKLVARIPKAFLTVYADFLGESPSDADFDLMTAFSDEAIRAAEARAQKLQKEQFGGVRTSASVDVSLSTGSVAPPKAASV